MTTMRRGGWLPALWVICVACSIGSEQAAGSGKVNLPPRTCPGALPADPNPYVQEMERYSAAASRSGHGAPEACPYHEAVRLYSNYETCRRTVISGVAIGAAGYAAQQHHLRQHGRESPLYTIEATKKNALSQTMHGTYTGNVVEAAIEKAYAGEPKATIKTVLFCQCLADSYDRQFGKAHEYELIEPTLCR